MRAECLRVALSGNYLKRSLVVTVVVGTILNLINQGDVLLGAAEGNVAKALLTYVVPFCVATFGAYSALLEARLTRP